MNIRRPVPADVPVLKKLLYDTWVDTYSHFVPRDVIDSVTAQWHDPKRLTAEIEGGIDYWRIAEDASGPIGILTAGFESETIQLRRLYIRPQSQRGGLGSALLTQLLTDFPKAKRISLEVEEKNPRGRAFYKKHGFEEKKRIRQDLGPIEAYVLLLERDLRAQSKT